MQSQCSLGSSPFYVTLCLLSYICACNPSAVRNPRQPARAPQEGGGERDVHHLPLSGPLGVTTTSSACVLGRGLYFALLLRTGVCLLRGFMI